jgi:hypothetical protein
MVQYHCNPLYRDRHEPCQKARLHGSTSLQGAVAVAFLPAFFILSKRAQSLYGLPGKEKEREQTLKAHGLTFSLPQISKGILTVSAPLFSGLIADLVSRVAEGT